MNLTNELQKKDSRLVEKLAEYAHMAWSDWMMYLFSKSNLNETGTVTIPEGHVRRWLRQMCTDYEDLSEGEKELDRLEARKIIMRILDNE